MFVLNTIRFVRRLEDRDVFFEIYGAGEPEIGGWYELTIGDFITVRFEADEDTPRLFWVEVRPK